MAAAWVKFRKRETVEKFDGSSPKNWAAYNIYDSMWNAKLFKLPTPFKVY